MIECLLPRRASPGGSAVRGCGWTAVIYLSLMRLAPLALASVAILIAAAAASSQALTACALQGMCAARAQAAVCASYIQGYMDGRNQTLPRPTICIPAGTSVADVAGGFVTHVGKNRLEGNLQAGLVLGNYLITAYPCR